MNKIATFTHFAVVVDGEVASYIAFPPDDEMNIAVYNSSPVFVQVPYEQRPSFGSTWDGEKFTAPEESK